ncbi:hypothetical protein CI238_13088 [Colletotrichum incanum]|uniref:Uncharacterized protein n=1 Tax=Colletotrichum incanum TaxID=1573173 RepID=A0A167CB91_COLIC|nr:hypothetical protein CI238_13088 [Colletotrichum incanum]
MYHRRPADGWEINNDNNGVTIKRQTRRTVIIFDHAQTAESDRLGNHLGNRIRRKIESKRHHAEGDLESHYASNTSMLPQDVYGHLDGRGQVKYRLGSARRDRGPIKHEDIHFIRMFQGLRPRETKRKLSGKTQRVKSERLRGEI